MRRGSQFDYMIINKKLNNAKFLQMPCSSPTYYIYHTCKDKINQLPSILLLYCIKSEQVMDRGENLPFKFPFLPTGLSGPLKIDAVDGVNSGA